jgi:hypothetical protein
LIKLFDRQLSHHVALQNIEPIVDLHPAEEMAHSYARKTGFTFEAAFAELAFARDKANNENK